MRAGSARQRAGRGPARAALVVAGALVASLLVAASPAHAEVLRPEDAPSHVGEEVTVEGEVASVVCSPLACLLSFSTDFSGLVASIDGDDVPRFPPPRETFAERRVRVRGTIVERSGRLRLDLRDPAQISMLGAPGEAAPAERSAAVPAAETAGGEVPPASRSRIVSPTRVTTRSGGPREPERRAPDPALAGIAATTDPVEFELHALRQQVTRLEETTRALADTVAALQERIVVLEQGGGTARGALDPSLLPEVPPYVVAGETSLRVQHVKKGWTSERLLRALGAPVSTVTEPNGYMTWYYPNGRAVTLDARGRVTSSIGF